MGELEATAAEGMAAAAGCDVEAALAASAEGRSVEVIDLRSLAPLDDAAIPVAA